MSVKEKIKGGLSLLVAFSAFIFTFCTVIELMVFLSFPTAKPKQIARDNIWERATWSLFVDQCLLAIFIVQHSVLALPAVKEWLAENLRLASLQRSVYIILTSLSLQVLHKFWREIPDVTLWNVSAKGANWWGFVLLHLLAWAIIYIGSICLDVNELLGIKQVYYDLQRFPDPNIYKSHELKRLYLHMRHPSFIGFLVIFWIIPFMSLDRLLLASILSIYMYFMWNTDLQDLAYHQKQYARKFQ